MSARSYRQFFFTEAAAVNWMQALNDAHAKGDGQQFVVAPGPDSPLGPDNYVVTDLDTAIESDVSYHFKPGRD